MIRKNSKSLNSCCVRLHTNLICANLSCRSMYDKYVVECKHHTKNINSVCIKLKQTKHTFAAYIDQLMHEINVFHYKLTALSTTFFNEGVMISEMQCTDGPLFDPVTRKCQREDDVGSLSVYRKSENDVNCESKPYIILS